MCLMTFFCMKFGCEQLLFEQFFDIIGNFCSVQPKSEIYFPILVHYNMYLQQYYGLPILVHCRVDV